MFGDIYMLFLSIHCLLAVHRAQQMDIIRLTTGLCTEETFQVVYEWFNSVVFTPLQWEQGM